MLTQIVPNILSHELTCCDFKAIDETDAVKRCAVGPNTVQAARAKDHRAIALPRFVNALNRFFYTLVARLSPSHHLLDERGGACFWRGNDRANRFGNMVDQALLNFSVVALEEGDKLARLMRVLPRWVDFLTFNFY